MDTITSDRPIADSMGAGGSLELTKRGSVLGKQAWVRKSYVEAAKRNLPFQKP
jgi:hypothetical protein